MKRLVAGLLGILVGALVVLLVLNQFGGTKTLADQIMWGDDQLFAVASLSYGAQGYDDYDRYLAKLDPKGEFGEKVTYNMGGDELYLVIPRYQELEIMMYEQLLIESDLERGDLIHRAIDRPHFAVKCNPSDLYSNVQLLSVVGGYVREIPLSTSLKDGSLNTNEFVLDLSK